MSRGVTLRLALRQPSSPFLGGAKSIFRKRPVPLSWHLAGLCVGVMFPVLVLLGYVFWHAAMDERFAMEAEGQRSAATIAAGVERDVTALTSTIQALGASPGIHDGNLWRVHLSATRLGIAREPNVAVVLMDPKGQQLLNTRLPFGTPLPMSNDETVGDIAEVAATKKPLVSRVFVGKTANEPIYSVMVPVFRPGTEDVTHVLGLSLPVKRIHSIVSSSLGRELGIGVVTDAYARIVARSFDHDQFVTKVSNMVMGTFEDDEGRTFAISNSGDRVRVFHAPVPGTQWLVSVGITEDRLNAPFMQFVTFMGVAGVGMLLVSFLIATVIGRGATRSLNALVASAEALGRNELVVPVATHIREINAVSTSLSRASEDLRAARDRHDLLINELNHRVKNTLATVQSMASQTARHSPVPAEFMPRFEARLLGLSASHNLLVESGWESADLADIARVELTPILGEESRRWQTEGPPLRLKAEPTLAVGMAFHELATNAVKYGALSNETGRVAIGWRVGGDRVELVWREVGGPTVEPPTRKGFGSRLIPRIVSQLDGKLDMDYAETGVVCTITFKDDVLA